ncbi:small VCP/p97-interacting protein [Dermacentor andersoni]|uniref:small VCP/p97-interacting protein n=1 Tax=Dermacentor andersoni TaxID=34620 RepID=UPI002155A174|nr:small VCP/p97-interacting protein-like [Dermacentor andersoni]
MGICMSCFKGSGADVTPSPRLDVTVKRQQMAEAAERRLKEQEHRGIKDPEKLKRQQQKREELEQQLAAGGPGEANLRWQVQ